MKRIILFAALSLPLCLFSQTTLKGGVAFGNRWNETLNSQTVGKGFRVSGEKNILPKLSFGIAVSYLSFNPNTSVNIRYNSYSLLLTYYFTTKKLQPLLGIGIGYTNYNDKTTLNLGGGISSKQSRNKNYGNISPFLGLQYIAGKKKKVSIFIQANADFIPVANIDPIGFVSVTTGIAYKLK